MATGTISFDIKADSSAALASVDKTDSAVQKLGKDAAATAATMTSAAKMEAAAWESVAQKIAATKVAQQKSAAGGGGLLGGLGSIGMASFGISAIKNSIAEVGGAIFKIAESTREFDNAVIKLRTGFGLTAEQAQTMGKSLQEAWRTGKSSMGELTETTRRLGEVMSTEQAVEWTKLLEDYAVQTGQSVTTLGTQLTKALQAGTVEARDLKALAKDGIPIWDLLSQTMGKSREEVQQLGQAGSITGADLQRALLAGRDAAKAFNDETAADSFETLSRTGSLALQKLGQGINKGLRPAIAKLNDDLGETTSTLQRMASDIGEALGSAINWAMSKLTALGKMLYIDGSKYESGPDLSYVSPAEQARQKAIDDAEDAAAEERAAARETAAKGPTITADPNAARKKRLAAAESSSATLDEKLAEAYAQNREALAKQRLDEEYKKLADAELKQLDDREKAWQLNEKIADKNAELAAKMERRQDIRDSAAADAAQFDRSRNWIERATPRQLELYQRGKSLGVDMSNPNSPDFRQVMRGFNPQTGKSFVQEQREERVRAALESGRGVSARSLSAVGSLRERLGNRVISSHRDDGDATRRDPYAKPLETIGNTLETIAQNTATDPVPVYA